MEYNFELAKPLKRYNSYYLLWKELRKQFGHQTANEIIELQLTGAIYINDFTDVALPLKNNTEHKQKNPGNTGQDKILLNDHSLMKWSIFFNKK